MSHLPKDWRFLRSAWIYAVVLTGNSSRASELVRSVFSEVGRRQDVVSPHRRRRLFFALLRREGAGLARCAEADFTGPGNLFVFHQLGEPARSALALFYSRLFGDHQLADVLGIPERDLPGLLGAARTELAEKISVTP